uniref:Cyclin dependent kinase 11B n=1 Tax=Molossus molossus TaxID=27622 RepID=A0A7J8B7Q0_MOLMO|nr:cyclin dependent kinase 11B [Molossus molossus]
MSAGNDIEKNRIKLAGNGRDRSGGRWRESIPGGRGTAWSSWRGSESGNASFGSSRRSSGSSGSRRSVSGVQRSGGRSGRHGGKFPHITERERTTVIK